MNANTYDVVIIGSGSVGTPTAMFLARVGYRVLVLDALHSNGQGSNKHAIGGIRATHSDPAKIYLCNSSIKIFSTWEATYGDDIEWHAGGYSFVAYDSQTERSLKDLLVIQKKAGLNIDWKTPQELKQVINGLNMDGLLGGTFSPEDGYASPLKSNFAFYTQAVKAGAEFHFNEKVIAIHVEDHQIRSVQTDKGEYECKWLINAAGSWAAEVSKLAGITVPVRPDSHEALVTEPVAHFMEPMIVDLRRRSGSANFYFYQNADAQLVGCQTPDPQIWGDLQNETSEFLPQICRRLIEVIPSLANLRIRRTWRGTYPMTPDGSPILGEVDDLKGYLLAVGTCGQGFMLGPGVGQILCHLIQGNISPEEKACLHDLRLDRSFVDEEKLG
ncbi:MAG TPA: FAD-binding oxidoreductase [Anaerolineaceae bacterium]|nr:FAD-binding oxidoreductase [Anaerolineaceae bacterium]